MQLEPKFLFMAFRYALGRATYVTAEVADEIIDKWDELDPGYQRLIQKEVKDAIKTDMIGHEMDRTNWERLLELKIAT